MPLNIPPVILPKTPDENIYKMNPGISHWTYSRISEKMAGKRKKEDDVPVFPGGEDRPQIVHYAVLMSWLRSPCLQEPRYKERRMKAGWLCGLLPDPKDESSVAPQHLADYLMTDRENPMGAYSYFSRMLSFQGHYGLASYLEMELVLHQTIDRIADIDMAALQTPATAQYLARLLEMGWAQVDKNIARYPTLFAQKIELGKLLEDVHSQDVAGFTDGANEEPAYPDTGTSGGGSWL